jgi:hypothetical protein
VFADQNQANGKQYGRKSALGPDQLFYPRLANSVSDTTAGARSHNRVDSGTYERTAPGIDQMISSNQPATLDRTPPALQYPHTNASATHLSYAPVTASSTAGVYGASYVSNASVNSNHNHSTYSTAYTPFPEHPGGSILPDRGEGLRVDRTQTRHPREQLDPSMYDPSTFQRVY